MDAKKKRKIAHKLQKFRMEQVKEYVDSICFNIENAIRSYSKIEDEYSKNMLRVANSVYDGLRNSLKVSSKIPDVMDAIENAKVLDINWGIAENFATLESILWSRIPTIDSLMKDLSYLGKTFDNVKFSKDTLKVVTHPVILDDVNFGRFQLEFPLEGIDCCECEVSAVALEPNHPYNGGDQTYTHPHVEYDSVCVGEGSRAIDNAIRDFRFIDYFEVLNTVLNTYGNGPFIDIEAWKGVSCEDCGDFSEESYSCECGREFCQYCIGECESCITSLCGYCAESCHSCDCRTCSGCLTKCAECNAYVCQSCTMAECFVCSRSMCESCEDGCANCHESKHSECECECQT